MNCFKIINLIGKGDLEDEKLRGSISRNIGHSQLSFLGTPGTILQNFARMQRTLRFMYSQSDITGDMTEIPLCT